MEEVRESKCSFHKYVDCDCKDKKESLEENDTVDPSAKSPLEGKSETVAESESKPNPEANCTEPKQDRNTNTNQGVKRGKNQRRRQRNNIQRIPGVPLQPLFPSHQRNSSEAFDLRDMLSRSALGDATAWWHSTNQNNYQPGPAKKARTDDNLFDQGKEPVNLLKNLSHKQLDKSNETKEDIVNPRKYVIVISDYPKTLLTEEQSFRIQSLLTNKILSFGDAGEAPKFWSCYLKQGALVVSCADDKSKDWLVENVPSISLEDDIQLKTGEAKDILLTTKVSLFIPKFLKDIEQQNILKLLKTQNAGIRTDLWNVLEYKEDDKGQHFSVAIDEDSFVAIKLSNYKVHLGLSLAKFSDPQFFKLSSLSNSSSSTAAQA